MGRWASPSSQSSCTLPSNAALPGETESVSPWEVEVDPDEERRRGEEARRQQQAAARAQRARQSIRRSGVQPLLTCCGISVVNVLQSPGVASCSHAFAGLWTARRAMVLLRSALRSWHARLSAHTSC